VAVGIFIAARFALQPEASKIFTEKAAYIGGSLAEVFKIQPRIWVFLVANTAWPLQLSADYVPQNVAWISLPSALAALVLLLAIQGVLAFKSRLALFGMAAFWLGLAPVSNFLPLFRPIADRFLYMPMLGVAATACAALLLLRGSHAFRFASATMMALTIWLACLAWQRQAVFASPLNLWRDTVAKAPFSPTAADNLGYALLNTGENAEALNFFGRALQLTNKKHVDAWAGAAIALDRAGRYADAEGALGQAIALDSRYGKPQELVEAVAMDGKTADALDKILSRIPPPQSNP
jgi:tetratricopeptide (TPR) repeat protein